MKKAKPNQPRSMADVPTPLFTLPFPRSCAIVLAATDAVCCQRTDTRMKTDATKISARATCDTGRDGNGFTSMSEPCWLSSSCQPGKVARRRKERNAKINATMLSAQNQSMPPHSLTGGIERNTHMRYGNTTASLNVDATQIRFKGSLSTPRDSARIVAFWLQRKPPPFRWMQIPKYPTRTSK